MHYSHGSVKKIRLVCMSFHWWTHSIAARVYTPVKYESTTIKAAANPQDRFHGCQTTAMEGGQYIREMAAQSSSAHQCCISSVSDHRINNVYWNLPVGRHKNNKIITTIKYSGPSVFLSENHSLCRTEHSECSQSVSV